MCQLTVRCCGFSNLHALLDWKTEIRKEAGELKESFNTERNVADMKNSSRDADDVKLLILGHLHDLHRLQDLLPVRLVISPLHMGLKQECDNWGCDTDQR